MSRRSKIVYWVLAVFMFLSGIVFLPSLASILMFLFAILAAPIRQIQDFLSGRVKLAGRVKTILLVILFFASALIAPTAPEKKEPGNTPPPTHSIVETTSPAPTSKPTPTPTPTPAPTPEPTPTPTPTPEPTPIPEQTPEPTSKASDASDGSSGAGGSTPQAGSPTGNEQAVYVTKTGKKYHFNSNCGNGTYYESTMANAKARGLTPCKKCAGG